MDNPGISLFQDGAINIENTSQNQEEAEDLEEQLRRREELQNLLTHALDDFKYDDSTMNSSSNVSIASIEHQPIDQAYKNAITPGEQLKVLYDVRMREINNLRNEFDTFKVEKAKEIEGLKSKAILFEAEVNHLQVSLRNAESLLEEKNDCINKMSADLENRNQVIEKLKRDVENFEIEVCAYKSTVHGLQLKIESETNPYVKGSKKFQSEELQNAHQQQILRLETIVEEQTRKNEILERDKRKLSDELRNTIESKKNISNEAENAVFNLTQSLNSAQKQCHDLLDIIEALTKENEHLRDRIKQGESSAIIVEGSSSFKTNSSPTTLKSHVEKLKQLLLDKEIELQTLKTKTKFYEEDVKELLEYRQIKTDVSNFDFNAGGDAPNNQKFLILQNELKTLKTVLENKEKEIATLDVINKELEGKIEEMLLRTRTEIQNISHKYSLPQLEAMNEDLSDAQAKIKQLETQIELDKLEKSQLEEELEKQAESFKKQIRQLENSFKTAQSEAFKLEKIKTELDAANEQTVEQLKQLKQELSDAKMELENNKRVASPSNDLSEQLSEAQSKVGKLEEAVLELTNLKTMVEGEKHNLQYQLSDVKGELEGYQKKYEEKLGEINALNVEVATFEKELVECNRIIKNFQENKTAMEKEIDTLTAELKKSETEISALTKSIDDLHKLLEKPRNTENDADAKKLQAEVLKSELTLREKLQEEYTNKINKIEARYTKVYKESTENYKEQIAKLKLQEKNYRMEIGLLLSEWAPKVTELEQLNEELREKVNNYEKNQAKLVKLVQKTKEETAESVESWKNWTKMVVGGCLEVEKINCKSRDKVVKIVDTGNSQVLAVEKLYAEKIKLLNQKR